MGSSRRIARSTTSDIPVTYVPARNTVLLALALGWAEVLGAECIIIGVNALDYSGYPDCRPEFLAAFEYLATLATRAGVERRPMRIWAPLQTLTKAGIIRLGLELGVDYGLTHSCYDPGADGRPCGRCDSCRLRARGFEEAGIPDPLLATRHRGSRFDNCDRSEGPASAGLRRLMTTRLYYTDAEARSFDATVLSCEMIDGRFHVALDRTAFYPTSGGQPFDTGTLGEASVVEVIETDAGRDRACPHGRP